MPKNAKPGSGAMPSNLSWRRSIDVSEGLLESLGADGTAVPVEVRATTVLGAIATTNAGYDKSGNVLVGEALTKAKSPDRTNILRIHVAALSPDVEVLRLRFSLAFHGASSRPDACSDPEFAASLGRFVNTAKDNGLFVELAGRYLWAIANGGPLWRNAVGRDKRIVLSAEGTASDFDVDALQPKGGRNTARYPGFDAVSAADRSGNAAALRDLIASALAGERYLPVSAVAEVRLYAGAEVYPSQEFVDREKEKTDLDRTLSYRTIREGGRDVDWATIHPQKLGNAVRTIDDWHGVDGYGVIPVEAFGWVQGSLEAIRGAGITDFYSMLRKINSISDSLEKGDPSVLPNALYTLAMMVRGGVYGWSAKDGSDGP